MKKKILLVNLPFFPDSSIFRDLVNLPLNLGYLTGTLRKNNKEVDILDLALSCLKKFGAEGTNKIMNDTFYNKPMPKLFKLIKKQIKEKFKKDEYFLVGINGDLFKLTFFILRELKKIDPNIKTVVGGNIASKSYGTFLDKKQVDFVVLDEGELIFNNLADSIYHCKNLSDVRGIVYKNEGSYIKTKTPEQPNIKKLPNPDYSGFEVEEYLKLNNKRAIIITARGCRSNCYFCGRSVLSKLRARSGKEIVKEVKFWIKNYGVKDFTFYNSMLNINKDHLWDLCNSIIKSGIKIRWTCFLKGDFYLNEESFKLMKKSGCILASFGVESGSKRILKICNKGTNIKTLINHVRCCKKNGIIVRCSFMTNLPKESIFDFVKTIILYFRIMPGAASFNLFVYDMGSKFFNCVEEYEDIYYETPLEIFSDYSMIHKIKKTVFEIMQKFSDMHEKTIWKMLNR